MDHNENWVIEAQDVSFTYEGNEEKALDGLELKIRRGSRVAFMGGNGSGKSTFFLCLNGIRKPDSGRICIDGKPIEYTRKGLLDVRGKVGIVFQEPDNQLFSASVYGTISFFRPVCMRRSRLASLISARMKRPQGRKWIR